LSQLIAAVTPGDARPTVLLADDDVSFRTVLGRALESRGFVVQIAADGDEACAMAADDPPELAVVDLRMPGRSGLEVVRCLRALDPATRVVVLTGYGSIATAVDAIKAGAVNYLPKPADADQVLAALGVTEPSPVPDEPPETPTLARVEWEHIQRVMQDCGGNVSEAARRLGLHRRSLQRKLGRIPPR
jgi:two-component system, response regulator RegA